jgi:pentatricopeptide repeat protein
MKEEGVAPNTITYNSLISACGKAAQLDQAVDTLATMQVRLCGAAFTVQEGTASSGFCSVLLRWDGSEYEAHLDSALPKLGVGSAKQPVDHRLRQGWGRWWIFL